MLTFVRVRKENYYKFKRYLVSNEKFFEPKIRTPVKVYDEIVEDDSQVTVLLFNCNFVGHIIGYKDKDKVFYLSSFLVVPKFRGKGYGKILLDRLFLIIRNQGYKFVDGHFNKYSLKLLDNTKFVKEHRVYSGYKYVRLRL